MNIHKHWCSIRENVQRIYTKPLKGKYLPYLHYLQHYNLASQLLTRKTRMLVEWRTLFNSRSFQLQIALQSYNRIYARLTMDWCRLQWWMTGELDMQAETKNYFVKETISINCEIYVISVIYNYRPQLVIKWSLSVVRGPWSVELHRQEVIILSIEFDFQTKITRS